ncbi:hypothetical protein LUZ60_013991 [Juncus effusus]|nr:hypothetical protein LUZ60_013991 [Juncus effusus]
MENSISHQNQTILFVYGTLKLGFPNHHLLSDLFLSGDAAPLSSATTVLPYPLLLGPFSVPFLLPLPSVPNSHLISGELISVSPHALSILDSFEGVSIGNYERDRVSVRGENGEEIQAEAYFANRSYAAEMWRRKGEKGVAEYTEEMAMEYVKPRDRPRGSGSLGEAIRSSLGLV